MSEKKKPGPKIRFNDPFHVEARKRMRESRARKKAKEAEEK